MKKEMKEHTIGEVFKSGGRRYRVEEWSGGDCGRCDLGKLKDCWRLPCTPDKRLDGKSVYFVEVKK